ncbi:ubiquitin-like domain-containing protein [Streptomyces sp. B1I3]|uniref:ubiquitin-like domain-containing protein n=1 Tax=Streptomyces sp. B1I3 TaxID=3042264 RepID=UPI0027824C43|nr:ubiquitin-like domain-containing protein [Streptomyces sp. B1I3]MDQ0795891.1 hypothetical protein [Streptomyces sp. B1I3]
MGHGQGSHRAPRRSRRATYAPPRVPAPAAPRSLHEERTIAVLRPSSLPVHDPTLLDTPSALRRTVPPQEPAGRRDTGRAAARRRRRSQELRRLVPQVLVVAVLAGGTSGFLAHDKAVRISVDGTSRTLHTFADDVGELLDAQGVTVGTRDTVAPAPGTGLDDGDEIVVRREARGQAPQDPRAGEPAPRDPRTREPEARRPVPVAGRGPRAPRRP